MDVKLRIKLFRIKLHLFWYYFLCAMLYISILFMYLFILNFCDATKIYMFIIDRSCRFMWALFRGLPIYQLCATPCKYAICICNLVFLTLLISLQAKRISQHPRKLAEETICNRRGWWGVRRRPSQDTRPPRQSA